MQYIAYLTGTVRWRAEGQGEVKAADGVKEFSWCSPHTAVDLGSSASQPCWDLPADLPRLHRPFSSRLPSFQHQLTPVILSASIPHTSPFTTVVINRRALALRLIDLSERSSLPTGRVGWPPSTISLIKVRLKLYLSPLKCRKTHPKSLVWCW